MTDQYFSYKVGGKTRRLEIATGVEVVRLAAALQPISDGAQSRRDATGLDAASKESASPRFGLDAYAIRPAPAPAAKPQTRSRRATGKAETEVRAAPGTAKPRVFKAGGSYLVAADRLIVATRDNVDLEAVWLTKYDLELVVRRKTYHVVRLRSGLDPFEAITLLSNDGLVSFAEPDFAIIRPAFGRGMGAFQNESFNARVSDQYALVTTKCREAWAKSEGERVSDVVIAIIDDGIDSRHPDLASTINAGGLRDFTDQGGIESHDGHGTACAGLAAAAGPADSVGVRGAGFGSKLCSARVAWSDSAGSEWQIFSDWVATAIEWAVDTVGARVISLSFGGGDEDGVIRTALENAEAKQVLVVAASGNLGFGRVEFPARLPTVLAVAAVDRSNAPVSTTTTDWGSTPGPEVDIAAPGIDMLTTDRMDAEGYNNINNYTRTFMGTSAATPIVAGVCALVIAANPALTAEQVRDIIRFTAQPIDGLSAGERNDRVGYGLIDAEAAVVEAIRRRDETAVG